MKIIKTKIIQGCLGGNNVLDILLDGKISRDFIYYLGQLGKLIITEDLSKPFFKVIVRSKFTFKGSMGNRTIRLLLPNTGEEQLLKELSSHIEKFV